MAASEQPVLNGVALNTLPGVFSLEELDMTPPAKKPEWAVAADADGANLIRTPLYENRTITATVRLNPQTTMDIALEKIGQIVDQLQEAEKRPGGVELVWTPSE